MQASRPSQCDATRHPRAALHVLTALCGLIGAYSLAAGQLALGQDADPAFKDAPSAVEAIPPAPAKPPPGPLRVMSWKVSTSPYAVAMRQIKSAKPNWRTSFGSERRTIDAPPAPRAIDAGIDVVLLQGITNPRALRRVFPARQWRLIFSPRALEALPKGSVFTAPVSSVEVEAIAIRFREGMRIFSKAGALDYPSTGGRLPARESPVPLESGRLPAGESPVPLESGIAVKIVDRDRTIWLGSIDVPSACPIKGECAAQAALDRWRKVHNQDGEMAIAGGTFAPLAGTQGCADLTVEARSDRANTLARLGKGQSHPILGCIAELTVE